MVLNLISPISSDPHLFSSLTMTDRTSLITVPGMTGIDILKITSSSFSTMKSSTTSLTLSKAQFLDSAEKVIQYQLGTPYCSYNVGICLQFQIGDWSPWCLPSYTVIWLYAFNVVQQVMKIFSDTSRFGSESPSLSPPDSHSSLGKCDRRLL